MKKMICLLLMMMMIFASAVAETVYVTISNGAGEIVVAHEAIETSDSDGDGVVSICDALFAAHEHAYEGGAQAGFEAADTDFGKSIVRLWGEENGSSYGYYVNNASAYSLSDAVSDGDSVQAYVYTDLESWSDTFCYFDRAEIEATAGEAFSLTLTMQSFDANWNPVQMPVEGAVITVNGSFSDAITDAEGCTQLVLTETGKYLVSAKSDTMTLVPPVCIVNVK